MMEKPITVGRRKAFSDVGPWFTVYPPGTVTPNACQEPCCRARRGEVEAAPAGRPLRVQCARCPELRPGESRYPGRLWVSRPFDAVAAMSTHDGFAHSP